VLASASPRRAELLSAADIAFDVMPAHVDESIGEGETAERYVRRLARSKAEALVPRAGGRPILGADTIVVVDDQVLGKPADSADASRMLRLLSGREHTVITGVCLLLPEQPGAPHHTAVSRTGVAFAPLSDDEVTWYVATGEPMDKAGAYAIQGRASRYVTGITGSYSNVVGLPVETVYNLCRNAGLLIS
jgi:septum formation protein